MKIKKKCFYYLFIDTLIKVCIYFYYNLLSLLFICLYFSKCIVPLSFKKHFPPQTLLTLVEPALPCQVCRNIQSNILCFISVDESRKGFLK